jgi:hypothetical protein
MNLYLDAFLVILASILSFLGCGYLALAQQKHVNSVFGRGTQFTLKIPAMLRGWLLIAASLMICFTWNSIGFAFLFWFLLLSTTSLLITLVLCVKPAWLRFLFMCKFKSII